MTDDDKCDKWWGNSERHLPWAMLTAPFTDTAPELVWKVPVPGRWQHYMHYSRILNRSLPVGPDAQAKCPSSNIQLKVPVLPEASKLPLDNVKPEAAVTSPEISIKPGTQIKIVLDKFWTSAGMNVVLWGSAPSETLLQLYVQRTLIVYWLKYVEVMFLKHACLSCVPYDVKCSESGHSGKWRRCLFEKFQYWQRHRSFHPKAWSHRQPSGWPPPAAHGPWPWANGPWMATGKRIQVSQTIRSGLGMSRH